MVLSGNQVLGPYDSLIQYIQRNHNCWWKSAAMDGDHPRGCVVARYK